MAAEFNLCITINGKLLDLKELLYFSRSLDCLSHERHISNKLQEVLIILRLATQDSQNSIHIVLQGLLSLGQLLWRLTRYLVRKSWSSLHSSKITSQASSLINILISMFFMPVKQYQCYMLCKLFMNLNEISIPLAYSPNRPGSLKRLNNHLILNEITNIRMQPFSKLNTKLRPLQPLLRIQCFHFVFDFLSKAQNTALFQGTHIIVFDYNGAPFVHFDVKASLLLHIWIFYIVEFLLQVLKVFILLKMCNLIWMDKVASMSRSNIS